MTDIAIDTTEPAVGGPGSDESRGFWAIVWRALVRPWSVRIAMIWICGLILLAIFVPFIANGHPFSVWVLESSITTFVGGEPVVSTIPAHREYPLFASLDRIDLILLVIFAAILLSLFVIRMTRKISGPDARASQRIKWMSIIALLCALICVAIGFFRESYNDPRDFRIMAKEGKIAHAWFAPIPWSPSDMEPLKADLTYQFPTHGHLLGTDGNGRDALSRLLWGTRIVLGIGIIAELIALLIGIVVGAFMGYRVGSTDLIGMRIVEVFESIPTFFLILTFVAIYGRQIFIIMIILGLTGWTGIARFVRAEFLRLRKLDFVQAAIASGLPLRRILFRHIMPNGLTPVIVTITFGVAGTVMIESTLSFLGVGVEPPTPSWGSMLFEAGNPAETFRWWLAIAPGVMIFFTVFAYNILGEGMRDAIDPKTNKVT